MRRIAYFGGSFDPPHLGHEQIVEFLAHSSDVDEILIVPTSQNPLKDQKSFFSPEQRRQLIEAWQDDLRAQLTPVEFSKVSILFDEMEKPGPAYTVETLFHLKKSRPADALWFLILGEDNLAGFKRWKNYEALLASIHSLWVFPRKSQNTDPALWPQDLRSLCPLRLTGHKVADVSSTEIRERWLGHHEIYPAQMTPQCAKVLIKILGQ